MDKTLFEKRKMIWEDALRLPGFDIYEKSAVWELVNYYNKPPEEIKEILLQSKHLFAKEWENGNIDTENESSVINFYNNTRLEIYELMNWHININESNSLPLNYVCAMEIAKSFGFKNYLDYGSGVGSAAILFIRNGFDVSCTDVSDSLLKFASYRFQLRNLQVNLIDLKKQELKKEVYNIITCFDVLEHAVNPMKILKQLIRSLKQDGILILNNAEIKENEEMPMHLRKLDLEKKLRCLGLDHLWNFEQEFKKSSQGYVLVLKKVNRPFIINALFFLYDHFLPLWASRTIKTIIRRKNVY